MVKEKTATLFSEKNVCDCVQSVFDDIFDEGIISEYIEVTNKNMGEIEALLLREREEQFLSFLRKKSETLFHVRINEMKENDETSKSLLSKPENKGITKI